MPVPVKPVPRATRPELPQYGRSFPVMQDILKHVFDKNLSQAKREQVGENLYNRGVYNSKADAEAIRTARSSR